MQTLALAGVTTAIDPLRTSLTARKIDDVRSLLIGFGLALVIIATAAVLFVALLWHRDFFWIVVPLSTAALYLLAWFSRRPLHSALPLALAFAVGGGLALEVFLLGAPVLALAYLAVGAASVWGGSFIVRSLRDRAYRTGPSTG